MTGSDTEAMSDTATATDRITQAPNAGAGSTSSNGVLGKLLAPLGSMKLAVVLLIILGLLTWLGTLAQIEGGLWAVQKEYFESWGLIAELPLSFWGEPIGMGDDGRPWSIKVPLPGAYPVMLLLFCNLLVGGMLRLRWHARNVGVLIVHIGIALLLVAGFVKLEYSYSGALSLYESPKDQPGVSNRLYESSTFVSFHDYELALLTDNGATIEERVVPEAELLAARGGTVMLRAEGLPFEVQVHHYLENCRPLPKGPMQAASTPVLDAGDGGPGVYLHPLKTQPEREMNVAGAYLTVLVDGKQHAQGIVYGAEMRPKEARRFPFTFEFDDVRYGLDLRKVVYDLPFALRLKEFVKRDHPGTMMAADYRSFVSVLDGEGEREAQIFMNTPLRKGGYVVYQTSWGPQRDGRPAGGPPWYSVFEVASNPSDQWPMYSCWVIGIGIFIHMMMKLWRFLQSSTRASLTI